MKVKNVNVKSNLSQDEEQSITDEDSEMDGEEEEDSEVSENSDEALDASATESDDESDIESEDNKAEVKPKLKSEKIEEEILQRYQERQGKQLYVRFPHKIPETQKELEEKVMELTPLAFKVHKPRQNYARFCLVDFATKEDRDTALKEIKGAIKSGKFKKYVVKIPRTESQDFVNELAKSKIKSIENKKAKLRLKKASKKSLKENKFTSTVIVSNLPKTSSMLQVRELFPNAVDINIKTGRGKINKDKSIAAVTLPTTLDAKYAIKKKFSLGGNQLIIKFDNQRFKKKLKTKSGKNNVNKNEVKCDESQPQAKKTKSESTSACLKVESMAKKHFPQNNNARKIIKDIKKLKKLEKASSRSNASTASLVR